MQTVETMRIFDEDYNEPDTNEQMNRKSSDKQFQNKNSKSKKDLMS